MAGQPIKRARNLAKEAAEAHDYVATENLPPEARAARIALSFVQNGGNTVNALLAIEPEAALLTKKEIIERALAMLHESRVAALQRSDRSDLEVQRKFILTHLVEMALDRQRPEGALAAIDKIAKIAGWYAPVEFTGKTVSLHAMMVNDEKKVQEALQMLDHEPGAAVAIQSDARDDYEARHGVREAE